ncbi:Uncharacterised protein [Mycobacteroides abscessus subsp. abscessus]|nr:Uncharacterised protein [Mycobacteroides abscessus subsp. abscessus]
MVVFSGFDERRVDVDTDDVVTGRGQEAADPARATTSVEDARAAGHQCVDQAGLTGQIRSVASHRTKAVDIPL